MVVAYPAGDARIADIAGHDLVHIARSEHRASIVSAAGADAPAGCNCTVHLKAGQGWSTAPGRFVRDYSVLDPYLHKFKNYGCYTYFFIGQPGWWALKKNIGPFARWDDLGADKFAIRIPGAEVLKQADLLFYRPDDRVLVIRGGYRGPAYVASAP